MTIALALLGCSKQADLDEVFEPPRPINQVAGSTGAPLRFELSPGSRVSFTLGPSGRRVRGSLDVVRSELLLNATDLAATRGKLTFDLSTLQVEEPSGVPPRRSSALGTLTEQSLRWLEVASGGPGAATSPHRFASFSIQSVGDLSAPTPAEGHPLRRREPGTVLRRVTFKVTGELSLHGYRVAYTGPVQATFHLPEPAQDGLAPTKLELATREPLRLSLVAHEIVPRDALGTVISESLAELRKGSVGVARVTARWEALPSEETSPEPRVGAEDVSPSGPRGRP